MTLQEKIELAKLWNLKANAVIGVGMALTVPVIHVYMIQHISADFYKIVIFLEQILALLSFILLDKKNEKNEPINLIRIRRYFVPIVIVDIFLFFCSNAFYWYPEIRFILITILDGTSSIIWVLVMQDVFNQVLSGTDLTVFTNKLQKTERIGSVVGVTVLVFVDLSLEMALLLQITAYSYMAIYDIKIYKMLTPELPEYKK